MALANAPQTAERALELLAYRVRPVMLAGQRRLPVLPPLERLLPEGLPRGVSVAVDAATDGGGATSLGLALVAGASQANSWVVAVGVESLGFLAAGGLGVDLGRLVVVNGLSRRAAPQVVAALLDGVDVVVLGRSALAQLSARDGRRLAARLRERGVVLVGIDGALPGGPATLRLTVTAATWHGIVENGYLRARRVTVELGGQGAAARARRAELWLPGPDGALAPVQRSSLRALDAGVHEGSPLRGPLQTSTQRAARGSGPA
jgi:hypothetical protein